MTTLATPVPHQPDAQARETGYQPEAQAKAPPPTLDDEPLYEIINGERVELPPMSAYAGRIASRLCTNINDFAYPAVLGEAVVEVLFRLPFPVERNRRPDVGFVSVSRWPRGKKQPQQANAWDVVPNVAAEVISPHDLVDELMDKIQEYFRSGVELVWVVYPRHCQVYVYTSPTQVRILDRQDTLDGGQVLPGFQLPLALLFPDEPEPVPVSAE